MEDELDISMEQWWNDSERGNLKYLGKTCHSAAFSTRVIFCAAL